jgi:hypothetical protein
MRNAIVGACAAGLFCLVGCGAEKAAVMEAKSPATAGGMPAPQEPSAPHKDEPAAKTPGFSKAKDGEADNKKADAPPATTPAQAQPPTSSSPSANPKIELPADIAKNRDLVIYTAKFTMAVYQVDQGLGAVEKIANDNGGYLGTKKDREITVRIPRGRFEMTLAAIDKLGDVLHRDIQAEDVTDEHVDLEIRVKNARAMQRRLSDLLTKADVKNALEIEKELHRVTEELERLEGKLKVLKDRVAFSTITVAFEPRGATLTASRPRLPFPWLGNLNLPNLLSLTEEK